MQNSKMKGVSKNAKNPEKKAQVCCRGEMGNPGDRVVIAK